MLQPHAHAKSSFAKRRIGLLGGSFNPAHAGHIHISLEAIKRLQLDEVWWLLSPKNPLKSASSLADADTRLTFAKALIKPHPNIILRDDERQHQLYFTTDSLHYFQKRYPHTRFVWLMGADNLAQFHRWKGFNALAHSIPIAVLDRAPYSLASLKGKTALRFAQNRVPARDAAALIHMAPPCWAYLPIPRHDLSASFLRKTLGKNAFFRHNETLTT